MMHTCYPSHVSLMNRYRELCGQHVGLLESQLLFTAKAQNAPNPVVCTNMMPAYHKILISESTEMSYHLSGYGIYKEEALIRLLGEGIERYSLLTAPTLYKKKIVFRSYNDIQKEGHVPPWEYIKVFSDSDYEKLAAKTVVRNVTPDDIIGWVKCSSIFETGKEIFIPAQLLFTGYQVNKEKGEHYFSPGFSKGAAAHTDIKKALKSAIIEAIEADAFMVRWLTKQKSPRIIIDDTTLLNIISELLGRFDYEIIPYYYSFPEMPAHAFGLTLLHKNNKYPFSVLGCQASLNPEDGIYRAVLEATAILSLAHYGPLVMPTDYLHTKEEKDYCNLDSNVAYWASPDDAEKKRAVFNSLTEGKIALSGLKDLCGSSDDEDIGYLLNKLTDVSADGVFLDITPPEVADKGWKVMRTFFPELVQISLPAFPYSNHPRIKRYGGVQNELPHPLP